MVWSAMEWDYAMKWQGISNIRYGMLWYGKLWYAMVW